MMEFPKGVLLSTFFLCSCISYSDNVVLHIGHHDGDATEDGVGPLANSIERTNFVHPHLKSDKSASDSYGLLEIITFPTSNAQRKFKGHKRVFQTNAEGEAVPSKEKQNKQVLNNDIDDDAEGITMFKNELEVYPEQEKDQAKAVIKQKSTTNNVRPYDSRGTMKRIPSTTDSSNVLQRTNNRNGNVSYQIKYLQDKQGISNRFIQSGNRMIRKLEPPNTLRRNGINQKLQSLSKLRNDGNIQKLEPLSKLRSNGNIWKLESPYTIRHNTNIQNLESSNKLEIQTNSTSGNKTKRNRFGGVNLMTCDLDGVHMDLSFSEHVQMETGEYLLTCSGSVTVNKCEGLCMSKVSPSVNHVDGFEKVCSCCRDASVRVRSVTLTSCQLGTQEVVGYSLARDIVEPTACVCDHCRN